MKKSITDFLQKTFAKNDTKEPADLKEKEERIDSIKSALLFAVLVLMIVLPIRIFVAKPFIVSGTSMFPTFDTWHYLIVDQITYRLKDPKRGDVIVFRYPRNPSRFFIKRIIALPGETIKLDGTSVLIKNKENPKGFLLDESYLSEKNKKVDHMSVTLGSTEYFVMGDNRKASADSRFWGPLERDKMIGRAFIRLFPFKKLDLFPGAIAEKQKNL